MMRMDVVFVGRVLEIFRRLVKSVTLSLPCCAVVLESKLGKAYDWPLFGRESGVSGLKDCTLLLAK